MVQIPGTYQSFKTENLVEYLTFIGVAEEKAKLTDNIRPQLTIALDGDKLSFTVQVGGRRNTSSFVLGQEVDEQFVVLNLALKSTATLESNQITIKSKLPGGQNGVRSYEFTETGISQTFTIENGPVARQYYNRLS